jgi:hypothetical protein
LILAGGTENVEGGGEADALTVSRGGQVGWFAGATFDELTLHPGAELVLVNISASATVSAGTLEIVSGGKVVESATLSGGGAGLSFSATQSGFNTVVTVGVSGSARPVFLAQAIVSFETSNLAAASVEKSWVERSRPPAGLVIDRDYSWTRR